MATNDNRLQTEIAALAEENFPAWRGLRPFPALSPPSCLEATGRSGWLSFPRTRLAFEVFRHGPTGRETWLFRGDDGNVCLIEVYGLRGGAPFVRTLGELGSPDCQTAVPPAAILQRPALLEGREVVERVFGSRGLALATRSGPEGQLELARARGFEVMPATRYQERFVDLPATRFLEAQ